MMQWRAGIGYLPEPAAWDSSLLVHALKQIEKNP